MGRTSYFAFSPKPDHPSRAIPIEQDAEGTDVFFQDAQDDVHPAEPNLEPAAEASVEAHRHKYWLHHRISASSSALCTPAQQAKLSSIEKDIETAHGRDPRLIHKPDENGMTPLHLAASMHNFPAVRALLGPLLGSNNARSELNRRDNTDGDTPLEACERSMLNLKEFSEAMLGRWNGYPDEALKCAYELRKAMGEEVGSMADYISAKKWGCTCGQCRGGFLSQRMLFRLLCE